MPRHGYTPKGGKQPQKGLDPRYCEICRNSYQPYRDSQRTCSVACSRKLPDVKAREAAYRQRPEVKVRKNEARRLENNPGRKTVNLHQSLRTRYGLEAEIYYAMLVAQAGVCVLCGSPPRGDASGAGSRLHVDHDHETGKVRALLCNGCNRGLGYLNDDPALLRAAADYIEQHKKEFENVTS